MSFLNRSIIIKETIEEVFKAATDFSKSPEMMEAVVDVELLTEGPVREGYQFREVREIRGRRVPSIIEVTNFDRLKGYSVRSEQSGIELRYHYTFTETTDGTRVDFTGELFTKGLRNSLAKPFLKKIIKKEELNHLEHMKKFIEYKD